VRSADVPETIASDHRPVVADLTVRRYSVSRTRYSQPYSTA
jgi:hypothetical protein